MHVAGVCMCASGWKNEAHQHKLQWMTLPPVKGVLRTMLTLALLATQRHCETLLRESHFQSHSPYKYLVHSDLVIPEQYKCKYNYTTIVSILQTWPSIYDISYIPQQMIECMDLHWQPAL